MADRLVFNVLHVAQVPGVAFQGVHVWVLGVGFSTREFYVVLFYQSLYLLHLMHPPTHVAGIRHLADNPLGRNNSNSSSTNFWVSICPMKNSLHLRRTMLWDISPILFSIGRDAQKKPVNLMLKQKSSWQMNFLLVLENAHPHTHTCAGLMGEKNILFPKAWILHASKFDYTEDAYVSSFFHIALYPSPSW